MYWSGICCFFHLEDDLRVQQYLLVQVDSRYYLNLNLCVNWYIEHVILEVIPPPNEL